MPEVFLPVDPVWICGAVALLLVVNYLLLHNKLYFIIDCAFVLFLAIITFHFTGDINSYSIVKPMVDTFYILLVFASMRLLNRVEFRQALTSTAAFYRKIPLLVSFLTVLLIWYAVITIPKPLMLNNEDVLRANIVVISKALERYSLDHAKHFPERLEQLIPKYIRELPAIGHNCDPMTERYYSKRHGISLYYNYAVDIGGKNYTLSLHVGGSGWNASRLTFTHDKGFADDCPW
ncbi:MAG: hypothetical protein AB2L14_11270 [Candidatus Xenobiia bacterium LiM19]